MLLSPSQYCFNNEPRPCLSIVCEHALRHTEHRFITAYNDRFAITSSWKPAQPRRDEAAPYRPGIALDLFARCTGQSAMHAAPTGADTRLLFDQESAPRRVPDRTGELDDVPMSAGKQLYARWFVVGGALEDGKPGAASFAFSQPPIYISLVIIYIRVSHQFSRFKSQRLSPGPPLSCSSQHCSILTRPASGPTRTSVSHMTYGGGNHRWIRTKALPCQDLSLLWRVLYGCIGLHVPAEMLESSTHRGWGTGKPRMGVDLG